MVFGTAWNVARQREGHRLRLHLDSLPFLAQRGVKMLSIRGIARLSCAASGPIVSRPTIRPRSAMACRSSPMLCSVARISSACARESALRSTRRSAAQVLEEVKSCTRSAAQVVQLLA